MGKHELPSTAACRAAAAAAAALPAWPLSLSQASRTLSTTANQSQQSDASKKQPQQPQQRPSQQPQGKDDYSLELTEEKFQALTDKIPQKPVGVVEGTSYTLLIAAAFGALGFFLYNFITDFILEPVSLASRDSTRQVTAIFFAFASAC